VDIRHIRKANKNPHAILLLFLLCKLSQIALGNRVLAKPMQGPKWDPQNQREGEREDKVKENYLQIGKV
jgi:hypothetical protein